MVSSHGRGATSCLLPASRFRSQYVYCRTYVGLGAGDGWWSLHIAFEVRGGRRDTQLCNHCTHSCMSLHMM